MSQNKKNINLEEINNEYRGRGVSEAVIQFTTENYDFLAKMDDKHFEKKEANEDFFES
jgi:hypothetical protein